MLASLPPRAAVENGRLSSGTALSSDALPSVYGERNHRRVVASTVCVALLLRTVALSRFPGIEADEGLWTRSSKNFVLYGDWFMDRHTHVFLSPLFHALTVLAYRLFGVSTEVARGVSGVAGGLSVAIFYLLVRRVTKSRDIALTSAIIMAVTAWSVLLSRKALIESLELFGILATAALLSFDGSWAVIAAGLAFGAVLLTKINAVFVLAPFGLYLLLGVSDGAISPPLSTGRWVRLSIFTATALATSGIVYALMYASHPTEFVQAFRFELNGVHFQALSHPIVRFGRFGIDPIQDGRTALALLREEPFVFVLAAIGLLGCLIQRRRDTMLFVSWIAVGAVYFLAQMFQPERYFYLLMPPVAFFAALAVVRFSQSMPGSTGADRRTGRPVLWLLVVFEVAYLGMNALANPNTRFTAVVEWARQNTRPTDRVLASAMLCTDLPNRAYAFYRLADSAADLDPLIQRLHINYVIVDDQEWPQEYLQAIAQRYPEVRRWPHATAYRTASPDHTN